MRGSPPPPGAARPERGRRRWGGRARPGPGRAARRRRGCCSGPPRAAHRRAGGQAVGRAERAGRPGRRCRWRRPRRGRERRPRSRARSPTAASRPVTRTCRPSSSETRPSRAGTCGVAGALEHAGAEGAHRSTSRTRASGTVDAQVDHVVVELDQGVGGAEASGRPSAATPGGRPAAMACAATDGVQPHAWRSRALGEHVDGAAYDVRGGVPARAARRGPPRSRRGRARSACLDEATRSDVLACSSRRPPPAARRRRQRARSARRTGSPGGARPRARHGRAARRPAASRTPLAQPTAYPWASALRAGALGHGGQGVLGDDVAEDGRRSPAGSSRRAQVGGGQRRAPSPPGRPAARGPQRTKSSSFPRADHDLALLLELADRADDALLGLLDLGEADRAEDLDLVDEVRPRRARRGSR